MSSQTAAGMSFRFEGNIDATSVLVSIASSDLAILQNSSSTHSITVNCPVATCKYFSTGFQDHSQLRQHILTHYEGTIACMFCSSSSSTNKACFRSIEAFTQHMKSFHRPEEFCLVDGNKCSMCTNTFQNGLVFAGHIIECLTSHLTSSVISEVARVARGAAKQQDTQAPQVTASTDPPAASKRSVRCRRFSTSPGSCRRTFCNRGRESRHYKYVHLREKRF
jgi:hypothetical protein